MKRRIQLVQTSQGKYHYKINRHSQLVKHKIRELEKNPALLYKTTKSYQDYKLNTPRYQTLRERLNKEYHFFDGMVLQSKSRGSSRQRLHKIIDIYNQGEHDIESLCNDVTINDEKWSYKY